MPQGSRSAPPPYTSVASASKRQQVTTQSNNNHFRPTTASNAYQPLPTLRQGTLAPAVIPPVQSFYSSAVRYAFPTSTPPQNSTGNPRPPASPTSVSSMKPPHKRQGSSSSSMTSSSCSSDSSSSSIAMPAGFTRQPRIRDPKQFSPMFLLSNSNKLEHSFPRSYPILLESAEFHPFHLRDVQQSDWVRFIDDFTRVARLPTQSNPPAYNSPDHLPLQGLINLWNQKFFTPRGVKVYLAQGPRLIAGTQNTSNRQSPDWGTILTNWSALKSPSGLSLEEMYRIVIVSL